MRSIFARALVLGSAVFAVTAAAQVSINVQIPGVVQVAPPPPRMERVPVMPPDRVWVPGNWQWHDGRYVWRQGHTVVARPDYVYAPGRWEPADGGWRWADGHWSHAGKKHHGHEAGPQGHCPPGQAKKGRC